MPASCTGTRKTASAYGPASRQTAPSRMLRSKYRRADGSPMWALTTFEPAGSGDGTFFGWVYDITVRKTAEQEAERARIETQ